MPQDEPERARSYNILGRRIEVTRPPRNTGPVPLVRFVLIVGALISLSWIGWHEFTYRQTGGTDLEYGVISHAGADMLIQFLSTFASMIGALLIVRLIQERGVRR